MATGKKKIALGGQFRAHLRHAAGQATTSSRRREKKAHETSFSAMLSPVPSDDQIACFNALCEVLESDEEMYDAVLRILRGGRDCRDRGADVDRSCGFVSHFVRVK